MHVHAMGMSCPVGLRWLPACVAIRAGISRKQELPYRDDDGEPIMGSQLHRLEGSTSVRARWVALLGWSLQEALVPLSRRELAQLPVILALPRDGKGMVPAAGPLLDELRSATELDFGLEPRNVHVVAEGAYGGLRALAGARDRIAERGACLVGGADSFIAAQVLLELLAHKRLLTARNPDGVIPGEASACLLLSASRTGSLASIPGLGCGREPALLDNDVPLRADGIVAATRAALAEARYELHDLDFRVSDAAGESYAFKEQALLVTRLLRHRKQSFPVLQPADALGDTGAAAGLCGLVMAVEAIARGKAPGSRAIVFAGNARGDRAAVVVESTERGRR
jgi:3-oxoacyl-[acyl-carrier-protein] synthase I